MPKSNKKKFRRGIAVTSGPLMVGDVGDDTHKAEVVHGHTISLAGKFNTFIADHKTDVQALRLSKLCALLEDERVRAVADLPSEKAAEHRLATLEGLGFLKDEINRAQGESSPTNASKKRTHD